MEKDDNTEYVAETKKETEGGRSEKKNGRMIHCKKGGAQAYVDC